MSFSVQSTRYEAWITGLAANQGAKRKRIMGAFASVLGDRTVEWGTQANLEHLPAYSSDQGVALIASERQLDVSPYDVPDDLRERAPYAVNISRFYGSGLGILLGLHFAGFPGAVVVQQNGRALELDLPLPPFINDWDPVPNLVVTQLGGNPQINHAWWEFDDNAAFCSRFAVLFPDSSPPFTTHARATFAASDSAPVVWNNAMEDTTYRVIVGAPVVTSGTAPPVGYDASSRSKTGMTATAGGSFTGYVDYWAYPVGASNPFVWLRASDQARLQRTLKKWRPAKATCMGVYAHVQGAMIGWPVRLIGNGEKFQPGWTLVFPGA